MNAHHEEALKKLDRHLDRMANPESEEDYYYALDFDIMLIETFVTSEYKTPENVFAARAGILDDILHVDLGEEVRKKMTTGHWQHLVKLVLDVCQKFNVASPLNKETPVGSKSFRQWWEQVGQEILPKVDYPDFIFERIPKTLVSAMTKQRQKAGASSAT